MRALAAFQDGVCPPNLLITCKSEGLVVDSFEYDHPDEILEVLRYTKSAPYSFLIHDEGVSEQKFDQVLTNIPVFRKTFNVKAAQGLFDPQKAIRQAYCDLSNALDMGGDGVLKSGAFEADLLNATVRVNDQPLILTRKEFSILRALMVYGHTSPIKSSHLSEHVYDENGNSTGKALHLHIYKINKKIARGAGDEHRIESVGSRGYIVTDHVNDFEPLVEEISYSNTSGVIRKNGKSVVLQPQCCQILDVLKRKKGNVVSKSSLCDSIGLFIGVLEVRLTAIRNAMREISGGHYIANVLGEGFFLSGTPVSEPTRAKHKVCSPA